MCATYGDPKGVVLELETGRVSDYTLEELPTTPFIVGGNMTVLGAWGMPPLPSQSASSASISSLTSAKGLRKKGNPTTQPHETISIIALGHCTGREGKVVAKQVHQSGFIEIAKLHFISKNLVFDPE